MVVNGKEVARKVRISLIRFVYVVFSVSGDKNVFLPLGTGRVSFIWEIYNPFQGRSMRERRLE